MGIYTGFFYKALVDLIRQAAEAHRASISYVFMRPLWIECNLTSRCAHQEGRTATNSSTSDWRSSCRLKYASFRIGIRDSTPASTRSGLCQTRFSLFNMPTLPRERAALEPANGILCVSKAPSRIHQFSPEFWILLTTSTQRLL